MNFNLERFNRFNRDVSEGQKVLYLLAARARALQLRMQLRDGVIRGCTKGLKVQSARRVKHVAREWRDNLELRACLGGRFI